MPTAAPALDELVLLMLDEDPDLRCESNPADNGHHCTVVARWVAGVDRPQCAGSKPNPMLWCDARYRMHLIDVASGRICASCFRPVAHWRVQPL